MAPSDGGWTWPPTAATLIAGEREAILVDTVPTVEDAQKLADWIEASGKELTTIYIAHGHFDHFLGSSTLLDRFPQARVVATEATVRLIEAEAESGHDLKLYGQLFVDRIDSTVIVPEALTDHRLDLEGHEVLAVATGRSDVDDSSYVYVPASPPSRSETSRTTMSTPRSSPAITRSGRRGSRRWPRSRT
ncbi:MBL fold metallo-hydrolase [Streptomyces sp. V4I2]|uniref:MBL fold metallo-hydrolase n=1 Tax=Streptomyces sp. V4I2 TaxID=3042280 RepID=UPI0027823AD0|nr:MBL fold metallo-hydrolase [Streptomyces sp. V4I2]MDQ1044069.1 glyoxylase-like metal-dependent hydrolase (beta-lactamase superfamily II) [Streptomyces sp. V4I2]